MKILITGAGFENKGAEAMLRTVQVELNNRLPDADFFLWRPSQWNCRLALNNGFSPFQFPFDKGDSLWHWAHGQRIRLLLWSLKELLSTRDSRDIYAVFSKKIRMTRACNRYLKRSKMDFDVLIDICGFAYGDSWGVGNFLNIGLLREYCQENGNPKFFLPQAWGNFEKPEVRDALREMLNDKRVYFYSRDEHSCRYLEQALEKTKGSIPVTSDIAFGFQGDTLERGESILRNMGCSLSRPIIGVAPNMQVYNRIAGSGMGNKYLQALVNLVDFCHKHHDVDIVLQSNHMALSQDRIDDRYLCSLIALSVANPNRCFMTREFLTAEATKALIGRFDYLIGSRFHSLVFGFSQGVPGMAVSWSHKYRELFSLFGMEDQVQEGQDIDADVLIEMFEKGWGKREEQRVLILKKAKQLQDEVNMLFDEVAEKLLKNRESRNA